MFKDVETILGNIVNEEVYNNPSCGPSCDRQRNA